MERLRRHKGKLFLLVLALFTGMVVLILRSQLAWDEACTLARRNLPALLGMEVGIGRCEIDPTTQAIRLYGVSAYPRGALEPLFSADSAELQIDAIEPFFGRVKLERLELNHPRINLDLTGDQADRAGPVAKSASTPECPIRILKRIQISNLAIKGAEVRVRLPQSRAVELVGLDVDWKLRRGIADIELDAHQGNVSFGTGRGDLALTKLSMEATLDVDEQSLEVARSEVGLDDITAAVNGKIEQLCDPSFTLEGQLFLPLKTAARALGARQKITGHLWTGLTASGKANDPHLALDLVGTDIFLGGYHPGDFTGKVMVAGRDVRITELHLPIGPGTAHLSGALTASGAFPIKLKADLENVELARVLDRLGVAGAWVNFPNTGTASLAGHLFPSVSLAGEADLKTGKFQLAARPWDGPAAAGRNLLAFEQGRVVAGVKILADRVEVTDAQISSGESHAVVNATLYTDFSRGLSIHGAASSLDLSDFHQIAGLPWSGKGQATFSVEGPYASVSIDANASFHDLEFSDYSLGVFQSRALFEKNVLTFPAISGQKGRTQYFGAAELNFAGKDLRTTLDLSVPHGRVEDLVDAIARLSPTLGLFQRVTDGDAVGKVHLDSPVGRIDGAVEVAFSNVTYYGRPLGDGGVTLRFKHGETMDLERCALTGPVGRLSAQGTYSFDGPLDYRFRGDGLSLPLLVGAERARDLGIKGSLTLVGGVEGDSDVPVMSAYLTSSTVAFGGRNLGETQLEGRLEGREMQIFGRPFNDTRGQLKMRLKDSIPYEAALTLSLPEIRPLLPSGAVSQGLSGSLSGTLTAKGMASNFAASQLGARIEKLTLSRGDFNGQNDGPIVISYKDRTVEVQSFDFRGPNTQLTAEGKASAERLDVKMQGAFDMRLLESFVPTLERTGGKIDLSAVATGPLKNPSVVGTAAIHDAKLTVRDQPVSLHSLNGNVEFSESRVLAHDVQGVLNDGRVNLLVDVQLDRFLVASLAAHADFDEVKLRLTDDLPITTSGFLDLNSPQKSGLFPLALTGKVDLLSLRYEKPLVLESFLRDLANARPTLGFATASDERPKERVRLNVDVHLGDVQVANNLAHAKLIGKLTLTGSDLHPGLLGTIETDEGGEAFYRDTKFAIDRGLIEFKDRNSIDPTFDIRAQAQARVYSVRMHAWGKPRSPQVVLTSDPALSEGDIISLLTFGVTSRDKNNTAGAFAGVGTEAIFQFTLGRQVAKFMPKLPLLREFSIHPSTSFNDYTGVVEPAAELESKFLVDDLKLTLTRPMISGRGTRVRAEYRVGQSISAEAQWDNENSDYSFGNLGLDLKLRWEIQ